MAVRFEGLKDAEWELFEDIFSEKPEKVVECQPSVRVPVVRSSARVAMGIEKRKPSLAQSMAS